MKRSTSYRRWLLLGCGGLCAALLALPGTARASKYDSDLAPIGSRVMAAVSPAPSPSHADKAAPAKADAKPAHSGAVPSWLSGGSGRHGSRHNR